MCELHKENYDGSSSLAPHGDIASIQRGFRGFCFIYSSLLSSFYKNIKKPSKSMGGFLFL